MQNGYDLGLILKKLRLDAGMSQQELGERINRDKGIISRYENNYQTPPFETMRDFAAIFNVSLDYLGGVEKQGVISIHGLTEEQAGLLIRIAELMRNKNHLTADKLTAEQSEVIGNLVKEFLF
ncbi:MAG: helix-turn-helix transcriptional regulator [Oscillospiraceae bacterium]|nr:helix-turn-helix transcriptional regulator [Oscillospiraceae bacterium]